MGGRLCHFEAIAHSKVGLIPFFSCPENQIIKAEKAKIQNSPFLKANDLCREKMNS